MTIIPFQKTFTMDASDVNWEPILEMLPTQELEDYDDRIK